MSNYQIFIKRENFPSYIRYLSEQEYRLLKLEISRLLKPYATSSTRLLDLACWDGAATAYYSK